ncbi:FAD-dependent thymidylate synthase [Streptomyces sp. ISL-22]|uniref:Flavin-dependent thymidylate synthase n=2 Tax=Streptomyces TaxID=1883 RepID=A0A117PHL9_9ACTN|nr:MULTISPECIES: FAD-dependent thymidylate synthase [Streptomyces]ELS54489.1 putative Thymidylate synthase thyX 2 [Streptomyces viridochromogenes Tue57]KUM79768.1 FAD-dependent thymidylate synthase [Streptomyces curacoi]MBT2423892.1 FAD-dependent thymidylate synthase [Streptomyces sp. ISL-24]MBT2437528.1 FAD-dependent thymidylate synthase [Streptomyces sp. ISL-22]
MTVTPVHPAEATTGPEIELRSRITVELVDHAASDIGVVRAARVSTAGERAHREERGDDYIGGLIRYLMRSRHGSPFEHNYMTFLVNAPIFTIRHMMRHRTWSFNEESARYKDLESVFYVPDSDRLLKQEGKPGHYQYVPGTEEDHELVTTSASTAYRAAFREYQRMLDAGIARELARTVLPVATYSTVYATCNARSLMHFLSLRTNRADATYVSHPQREVEIVAEQMESEFARLMPLTHAAYESYGRVSP